MEDSNANLAPTWRDRDSSDEVCGGGVRNADDRVSTPSSEVVDALEHDLPEVFAMSDDGQTAREPPVTAHTVIPACERDNDDASSVHSESCWGETEELSGEDDVEWGMLPLAGSVAVQTVREEGDSAAPIRGVHPPTGRLVLVGGVSRSQNRFSLFEREEEENEVHIRGQDRQRGMRVSQRCAHSRRGL